jgi:hypothetical protein
MSSHEIHDAIQTMSTEPTAETIRLVLNLLDALNARIDTVEAAARHAGNVASCLANGIVPD